MGLEFQMCRFQDWKNFSTRIGSEPISFLERTSSHVPDICWRC